MNVLFDLASFCIEAENTNPSNANRIGGIANNIPLKWFVGASQPSPHDEGYPPGNGFSPVFGSHAGVFGKIGIEGGVSGACPAPAAAIIIMIIAVSSGTTLINIPVVPSIFEPLFDLRFIAITVAHIANAIPIVIPKFCH